MKKSNTFKCRIEYNSSGNVKITSFSNQQISGQLFNMLNTAVHQVAEKYNGEAEWKKTFIRFNHDGKTYEQIEATDICKGCVFRSMNQCNHPHYTDGTKGNCSGYIYKEIK